MKNFFVIILFLCAANLNAQPLLDIDADNDGLIEVSNLGTLNAIRYQLDGSGLRMNADAEKVTSGCAVGGCKGYELTGDLDFLDAASYKDIANLQLWTNGIGWQPIGDSEHPFNAIFKTNNSSTPHTIFNLTINRSSEDNVGLFGSIGSAAEISGIGLLDADVTGRHRVGGLIGENGGGQVSNSYASGHVVGSGGAVGLLVGSNSGAITNSYADGEVSGKDNSVGGLVGVNSGNLSNSYAIGNVVGKANNVGGLVGDNSQGTISNSYASASVSGSEDIGGLVGLSNLGTLVKNYVSGKATGIRYVGGLVGMNIGGTISSSYWDKTASALEGNSDGVGLSASELQSASAQNDDLNKPFYQWSTADWDFGSDEQYPILKYATGTDAENPACGPEPSLPNCGSLLLGQHSSLKRIILLADASLTPRFKPTQFNYHLNITPAIKQLQLIPIANNPNSIISISMNSTATVTDLASGTTSTVITLDSNTEITIAISAPNQRPAQYQLTVNYLPTIIVSGMPSEAMDEGKLVILDASPSNDAEGEPLSYRWTQSVGKALVLEATDQPTLVFKIPEDYVSEHATNAELGITVAVNDGKATASQAINIHITKIDNGTITVAAPTPSVTAWTAPEINLADDPDGVGSNLQYQWQSRIPNNNAGWIDIAQATQPTYTPSILTAIGTQYRVRINYTDGQGYATTLLGEAATYQPEIATLDFAKAQATESESPSTTVFQCSTTDIDQDKDGLIEICDLEGLNAIRYQLDSTGYELMRDLDFSDDASYRNLANKVIWTTGKGWQPIGYYKTRNDFKLFKAIFDGNDHTISNLMINRPRTINVGLFGYTASESRITNIGLLNVNIQGASAVGGLVGDSGGSIRNSYATGIVSGNSEVGGLVGSSYYGSIRNSYATGIVSGNSDVGGLVGSSRGDITNSYATGAVTGDSRVGGLVGDSGGSIRNSYATGIVSGNSEVGGLVGSSFYSSGRITNSYATGAVTGDSRVGGLVGFSGYNSGIITNSYATGAVTGLEGVGGLVGSSFYSSGRITNSYATGAVTGLGGVGGLVGYSNGDITNSYATGVVTGDRLVGGLVGHSSGDITNSYWDTETSGIISSAGGIGKTTEQLQKPTTPGTTSTDVYYDWSSDDWDFGTSSQYPILKNSEGNLLSPALRYGLSQLRLAKGYLSPDFVGAIPDYTGSVVSSSSTIQLIPTAVDPNASIHIMNSEKDETINSRDTSDDIELNEDATTTITIVVTTAGKIFEYNLNINYYHFSGDVDNDGDGLIEIDSIEKLNAIRYQPDSIGYRKNSTTPKITEGCPETGCIGYELTTDLSFKEDSNWSPIVSFAGTFEGNGNTISNLKINRSGTDNVGLFGSVLYSAKINNLGLLNVYVQGNSNVGGLVGYSGGTITNSYATGAVSGNNSRVGGLVGYSGYSSSITNSYATGAVSGDWSTGGLVGRSDLGSITNSYATGAVRGDVWVGGLVGYSRGNITNSYAIGAVSGNSDVGGLVGFSRYGSSSITNSYWDTETSGITTSAGGTGKTTPQLQSPTGAMGIYRKWSSNNWDFGTAWHYPVLKYAKNCGTSDQPACGTLLPDQYSLLDALAVNGILSPEFDPETFTFSYDVTVKPDVDTLTLSTTATDAFIRIYSNLTPTATTGTDTVHTTMTLTIAGATVITIEVTQGNRRPTSYILTVSHRDDDGISNLPNLREVVVNSDQPIEEGETASLQATLDSGDCGSNLRCEWGYFDTAKRLSVFDEDSDLLNFTVPKDYVDADQSTQELVVVFAIANDNGIAREKVSLIVKKIDNGSLRLGQPTLNDRLLTAPEIDLSGDVDGVSADPDITYQWQRKERGNNWEDIYGETARTYTINTEYAPLHRVRIRYTDGQGYNPKIYSKSIRNIDVDGDGLIEIQYLEELDAIRHQLDGSGYKNAGVNKITTGCADGGCKGYELIRDLDFNDYDSYRSISNKVVWTRDGWEPIGGSKSFKALFNGNGYTISNLMINKPENYIGLFSMLKGGKAMITDVNLNNININGKYHVGGLVGKNQGGTIRNISISSNNTTANKVVGEGNRVGGLVGTNTMDAVISSVDIYKIKVEGDNKVGGLVGTNAGRAMIVNSSVSGDGTTVNTIEGIGNDVGGLVGKHEKGYIINSYAVADVQSATSGTTIGLRVGGLVGHNQDQIINSYAAGSVTANKQVGGLVGKNEDRIINSYAISAVTGKKHIGNLVGSNDRSAVIESSYWDNGINSDNIVDDGKGMGKTTVELQLPTTATGIYEKWSGNVWDFGTKSQYPALKYANIQCIGEDGTDCSGLSEDQRAFIQSLCTGEAAPDYCGTLLPGQRIGLQSLELSRGAILLEEFASEQFNYTVLTDRDLQHIHTTATSRAVLAIPGYISGRDLQHIHTTATAASPDAEISIRSTDDEITITVIANERTVKYILAMERLIVGIKSGNTVITEHTFTEGEPVDLKASLMKEYALFPASDHRYLWSRSSGGEGLLESVEGSMDGSMEGSDLYFTIPAAYVESNTSSTNVTLIQKMTVGEGNQQLMPSAEVTLTINKKNNDTITTAEIGKPSLDDDLQITAPDLSSDILLHDSDGENANPAPGYQWQWWNKEKGEWGKIPEDATNQVYQVPTETEDETRYRVLISYTDGQGYRSTTASDSITFIDVDRDNDGLIEIEMAKQLNAIRHQLDGSGYSSSGTTTITLGCPVDSGCIGYELKAHIDLDGMNWQPLGSYAKPFNAIFKGNHYTISNLTITTTTNYVGLFAATTTSAEIYNVGLLNVEINANDNVGGLVGNNEGIIDHSHVIDKSIVGQNNIGGLVGNNKGTIKNSHVISMCIEGASKVGALIGFNNSDSVNYNYATMDTLKEGTTLVCKLIGNDDDTRLLGICPDEELSQCPAR